MEQSECGECGAHMQAVVPNTCSEHRTFRDCVLAKHLLFLCVPCLARQRMEQAAARYLHRDCAVCD